MGRSEAVLHVYNECDLVQNLIICLVVVSLWAAFKVLQNIQLIHRMQDECVELHLKQFLLSELCSFYFQHVIT